MAALCQAKSMHAGPPLGCRMKKSAAASPRTSIRLNIYIFIYSYIYHKTGWGLGDTSKSYPIRPIDGASLIFDTVWEFFSSIANVLGKERSLVVTGVRPCSFLKGFRAGEDQRLNQLSSDIDLSEIIMKHRCSGCPTFLIWHWSSHGRCNISFQGDIWLVLWCP